jgi:tetratricopeptide (TPR) repeat protein
MAAPSKMVEKAREAAKKKNYDYAVELFIEHLKITPADIDARKELRAVERERHKLNPPGMLQRAKVATQVAAVKAMPVSKKDPEKTMLGCEDVLKLDPTAVNALLKLGEAASYANLNDVAVYVFEDALALDAKNAEALRLLGRVYEAQGDFEKLKKAYVCFERLAKYAPQDKEAQDKVRDLAAKMAMAGKQDEQGKVKGFTDLIDKDAAKKLEQLSARVRTPEQAMERIEATLQDIEAKDGKAEGKTWRLLGEWAILAKQWDRAIEFCDKALAEAPTDYVASELKGDVKFKRYEESLKKILDALKKSPDDATLKAKLDNVKKQKTAFEIEEYTRRVDAHPTEGGIRFYLGKALYDSDQTDEAIKQLQQAKTDPRRKAEAGLLLGKAFGLRKKIYQLAVKELETAREELVEMDDIKKDITYHLGRLHEAAKKPDRALTEYSAIAESDYNYKDVTQRMEKLGGAS